MLAFSNMNLPCLWLGIPNITKANAQTPRSNFKFSVILFPHAEQRPMLPVQW